MLELVKLSAKNIFVLVKLFKKKSAKIARMIAFADIIKKDDKPLKDIMNCVGKAWLFGAT